jgi:hypothetical protein
MTIFTFILIFKSLVGTGLITSILIKIIISNTINTLITIWPDTILAKRMTILTFIY